MSLKLVAFNMDNTLFSESSNFYIARYVAEQRTDFSLEEFLKREEELREKKKQLREDDKLEELCKLEDEYTEMLRFRQGLTQRDLDAIFRSLPFYKGIAETLYNLKNREISTALITTGPEPIAKRCKDKFGFDYRHATVWKFRGGKFTGDEFNKEWNKGNVLQGYQTRLNVTQEETAVVEYSDWNICDYAGLVVLFNPHKTIETIEKELKDRKVFYVRSENMRDVLSYLV